MAQPMRGGRQERAQGREQHRVSWQGRSREMGLLTGCFYSLLSLM